MNEEHRIEVTVIGPDRYCEFCGRMLVHVNDDGTINLSAETSVELLTEVRDFEAEGVAVEAICHRSECVIERSTAAL